MKFLLATLLIGIISCIAGLYLPWWSIAIVCFLVTLLLVPHTGFAFLSGFTGIFLLWFVLAFWIDVSNKSILSQKIALIIPLGGSSILLILVTALIGGLVGGFAALAGSSLRVGKRKRRLNYRSR